ncbi:MAG: hypothetical protein PSV35_09240, partial [bacterium]|nr:hypothetical protein [bacterium]
APTQSWWSKMKSSPLGTIGAILGVILVFPAVIVTILNNESNKKITAEFAKENGQLASEFDKNLPTAKTSNTTMNSLHAQTTAKPSAVGKNSDLRGVSLPYHQTKKAEEAAHQSKQALNKEALRDILQESQPLINQESTTEIANTRASL